MRIARTLTLAVLVAGLLVGCFGMGLKTPSVDHARMDNQFALVFLDRLLVYIDTDDTLTPTERATMKDFLGNWCAAAASLAVQHGEPAPSCPPVEDTDSD